MEGREKVWSYRHHAKRGDKKGPQDVLLSATPPPQCSYHLSTYCHNKQLLILASILHSNQRLKVGKRLLGERELGGGGVHAHMHPSTHTHMNAITQPTPTPTLTPTSTHPFHPHQIHPPTPRPTPTRDNILHVRG